LNNQTFLNEILGNLLESFKDGNDVDGKTMSNAISIWKYFGTPSTTECTCDLKTSGKATRKLILVQGNFVLTLKFWKECTKSPDNSNSNLIFFSNSIGNLFSNL